MITVIDVGNTNITIGVLNDNEVIASFRLTTSQRRTSDEFVAIFYALFHGKGINENDVEGIVISSVVPKVMHSLRNSIYKFFKIDPIIIGAGIKTGIKIKTEDPKSVGADRIVDLVAGHYLHGGPLIVIDFGTATTYDYLNEKGEFDFGLTAPGIETSAMALWDKAAQLPEIEIKKPETIKCKNTITSMQGGLVFGYIGQTEYIIKKIKEEVGDAKVVATGGLGRIICNETKMIDEYDPNLSFKGMRIIYKKNSEKTISLIRNG